jgi:hypothetical protein
MVIPFTNTEIGPDPASAGTVVIMLFVVDVVTVAGVPLKVTMGVVKKFVPIIVTVEPGSAPVGLIFEIVGVASTSKPAIDTVTPLVVTVMGPSVAPEGTVAVSDVGEDNTTLVEVTLLNFTTAGAVKLVPVIVITAPTAP